MAESATEVAREGAQASAAVSATKPRTSSKPRLGDKNPNNPMELRLKCDQCKKERWVQINRSFLAKIRAAGWVSTCYECSRIMPKHTTDLVLPSGSIAHLGRRRPGERNKVPVTCGICGETHDDLYHDPTRRRFWKGFCEGCKPWALVALKPEHEAGPSPERDAIYAKIKRLQKAFEENNRKALSGSSMPFWVLAKRWSERMPLTKSYQIKLLTLYFDAMPIGEIKLGMGTRFRHFLLHDRPRRGGKRSAYTNNQTLMILRRMLTFAKEHGWIKENPFPRGAPLTPYSPPAKSDRLMTVEEEKNLLAACIGDRAYLRGVIICLVDTGMYESDRRKLTWTDINLEKKLIKGKGLPMEMTPRLLEVMKSLRDLPDHAEPSTVWGSKEIRYAFKQVCIAAGLDGLLITDLRRTAAWRMKQAGKSIEQIADMLGIADLNDVRLLLEVNPETAEQEINSPFFKEFLSEQFRAAANGDNDFVLQAEKAIGVVWGKVKPLHMSFDKRLRLVTAIEIAAELHIGDPGSQTSSDQLRKKLERCDVRERFRGEKQWFPAFVKSIIEKIEGRPDKLSGST